MHINVQLCAKIKNDAGQCTFVRNDRENITNWLMDTCLKYQEECWLKYNSVKRSSTISVHRQLTDKNQGP